MRTRLVLLVAALGLAAGVGVVSVSRVREQLSVMEACEATQAGAYQRALAGTEGRVGTDETGLAAAECRCLALLATGAGDECVGLLETLLADPASGDWAPSPVLAVHLIQTWRDRGRSVEAAELARRAARRHPDDPDLFYLELLTRSGVEDEATVLRELAARIPAAGEAAARMRVSLANRYVQRGDPHAALETLGSRPPEGAGAQRGRWYETRGLALASEDNLPGVQATYAAWRAAGGAPDELLARYALTLSLTGLVDPERSPVELLRDGLAASERVGDDTLREALTIRLILTLVNAGRPTDALALYDRARQEDELELAGLSREELLRSAQHLELADAPAALRRGTLRFRIDAPEAGFVLRLSPDADAPLDAAFEELPVPASGRVAAQRALGTAPQRWVLRDGSGAVRASGTVHPVAGAAVDVTVAVGAPRRPLRTALARRPADGRRRVALVLLDCADWRIAQYLRARGELPVFDALLRAGHRAVLESVPPLTAAALEALVRPERRSGASFVGLVHQFGLELAGLASVGDNPLAALSWLLPEDEDLFSVIGAGERSAANLLFAHGGIRAGRHGEVTGPQGLRRRVPLASSARDLDAAERARWPELAAGLAERDALHVRTIAAELDAAEELVRAGEVDFFALRVEPLDILTHAHFAEAVRGGQDDGEGLLFSVYRYIDARLAGVHDLLDADDVFVLMSDHGIRTAMEHSRHAIFVASGGGLPAGRAPGQPALRGVPAVLAAWMGVETGWPRTGVAPVALAGSLADARAKADPPAPHAHR